MRRALAVVALAALSCAAGWWWGRTHPAAGASDSPAALAREAVESASLEAGDTAQQPRRTPAPAATAPLPPDDAPLRDSFDTLDALARAGNAQAACRLAAELSVCSQVKHAERSRVPLARRLDTLARRLENSQNRPDAVAQIEREMKQAEEADARHSAQLAHCRDSDVETRPSPNRYLLLPALRGHRMSRMWYLGRLSTAELLRDPGLGPEYLANARPLLQRGIEDGDLLVVILWWLAVQNPEITPLSAVLPAEWRSRGLLTELLARIREQQPIAIGAPVDGRVQGTPEEKAEASRLFEAHFRHARAPALMEQLAMHGDLDVALFACDELAPR